MLYRFSIVHHGARYRLRNNMPSLAFDDAEECYLLKAIHTSNLLKFSIPPDKQIQNR